MIEIRKGDYVEVIHHKGNQFNELVNQRGVVIASYDCKMAVVDFGELVECSLDSEKRQHNQWLLPWLALEVLYGGASTNPEKLIGQVEELKEQLYNMSNLFHLSEQVRDQQQKLLERTRL